MSHRVVFRSAAERDLNAIDNYISADSPERALAFVRRIRARCEELSEFPLASPLWPDAGADVRLVAFERRVVILYRVLEREVAILRVLYGGRRIPRT